MNCVGTEITIEVCSHRGWEFIIVSMVKMLESSVLFQVVILFHNLHMYNYIINFVFKPGSHQPHIGVPGFLKLRLFANKYVCVCVCVCLPLITLITSEMI